MTYVVLKVLQLRDIINIGPEVGVSAGFDLDLNGELNFTTGARATVSDFDGFSQPATCLTIF